MLAGSLACLLVACSSTPESDRPGSGTTAPPATQTPLVEPADGDWPVYGHDRANTRTNPTEKRISAANVAGLQPAWRIEGLTGQTSTPAVVDGVVYFGDWSGRLHAVRAETGATVWTKQLETTEINDSPLVTDDTVYVGDGGGQLRAIDTRTGDERFHVRLDPHPLARIYSSPVRVNDMIVIGVAGVELVVPKADYTFRGSVVALDARTGAERWRVYTTEDNATAGAGASVWSTPAVDESRKLLYVGVGQTYEKPASPRADAMLAIRYETGEVAWVHQFTKDDIFNVPTVNGADGVDADVGASPNCFRSDGRDVVGVGDKAGRYWTLDRETGAELWHTELTNGSRLGGVMTTAAVHDDVIYVASNVGLPDRKTPGSTAATFALRARDGGIIWRHDWDQTVFGALTYANGVVFHGTTGGRIVALDATSGELRWSTEPGADVGGGFSVVEGTLYAGYGFWLFQRQPDPNGGMTAYRLP